MYLIDNYTECMQKYFMAEGRASRKEFWSFMLALFIISGIAAGIGTLIGNSIIFLLLMIVTGLIHIIPTWTVTIRRLHDLGRTGWWVLLYIVPIGDPLLAIVNLLFMLYLIKKGEDKKNLYGAPVA